MAEGKKVEIWVKVEGRFDGREGQSGFGEKGKTGLVKGKKAALVEGQGKFLLVEGKEDVRKDILGRWKRTEAWRGCGRCSMKNGMRRNEMVVEDPCKG